MCVYVHVKRVELSKIYFSILHAKVAIAILTNKQKILFMVKLHLIWFKGYEVKCANFTARKRLVNAAVKYRRLTLVQFSLVYVELCLSKIKLK